MKDRRAIHRPSGLTVKIKNERTKGGQKQYQIHYLAGWTTWIDAKKVDLL